MTALKIHMSASPESTGKGSIPSQVSFSPSGNISLPPNSTVSFVPKDSLVGYINDKALKVILVWQGVTHILGSNASVDVAVTQGIDKYQLTVCNPNIELDGGENGTSTSGEIIVESPEAN